MSNSLGTDRNNPGQGSGSLYRASRVCPRSGVSTDSVVVQLRHSLETFFPPPVFFTLSYTVLFVKIFYKLIYLVFLTSKVNETIEKLLIQTSQHVAGQDMT